MPMAEPKNESLHLPSLSFSLFLSLALHSSSPRYRGSFFRAASPFLSVPSPLFRSRCSLSLSPLPLVASFSRLSPVHVRYHMAHMHACMHAFRSERGWLNSGSGQGLGFPSLRGEENRSSLKSCPTGWALGELTLLWSTTRHPTHSPPRALHGPRSLSYTPPIRMYVCTHLHVRADAHRSVAAVFPLVYATSAKA